MLSRVSPFGYPRINGYLRLPAAFRSLSRPSSATGAKASSLRSFMLDLSSGRAQNLFAGFLPQLVSFFPFEFARILVRQLPAFQLNCFPQFPFTCFPYCCLLKFVSSLFSSQGTIAFSAEASASPLSAPSPAPAGYGLKWTRTTDLALIRRAL